MKKSRPFFISGLELIKISELPPEEADYITRSVPRDKFISINTDSIELRDCILYREYERFMAVFNLNSFNQYFDSQI